MPSWIGVAPTAATAPPIIRTVTPDDQRCEPGGNDGGESEYCCGDQSCESEQRQDGSRSGDADPDPESGAFVFDFVQSGGDFSAHQCRHLLGESLDES